MMKRFRIGLVSALVTIMAGIAWLALRKPPDPVCQGKPLSMWLESYVASIGALRDRPGANLEADAAIRQIGTNALPLLLDRLRTRDSGLKITLINLAEKQGIVRIKIPFSSRLAYYATGEAAMAFHALGPNASNAVPQLIQTYRDNIGWESQMACLRALGWIGPAASRATPDLLGAVTNATPIVRGNAIEALADIHLEPALLVPVIKKSLQDTNTVVRFCCFHVIVALGPKAKAVVPEVNRLLQDSDPHVATFARIALEAITPEAATNAEVK